MKTDYPKTRQIMRLVSESAMEGGSKRGYALRDGARAAIEQMEDDAEELANALRDVLAPWIGFTVLQRVPNDMTRPRLPTC